MATAKEEIAELKVKCEDLTNKVDLLYKAIEEIRARQDTVTVIDTMKNVNTRGLI